MSQILVRKSSSLETSSGPRPMPGARRRKLEVSSSGPRPVPAARRRKLEVSSSGLRHFSVLERCVNEAFEQGLKRAQDAVEVEKSRTYLEVGRFIDRHLLFYKDRADYGKKIIPRLAQRTGKSATLLYDCLRFARQKAILPARGELLSWGIYKELLAIEDAGKRGQLESEARARNWSTRDLAREIQKTADPRQKTASVRPQKLLPKRGEFYHYRVISSGVPGKKLQLDLGFKSCTEIPSSRFSIQEGDIVTTEVSGLVKGSGGKYRPRKISGSMPEREKKLFTYWAYVLRIIDGDTLLVWVELGFGAGREERLRLRGLDVPEINTKRGKAAKIFAENEFKHSRWAVITTTRAVDPHDRYLSDVFTAAGPVSADSPHEAWSSYLNGELLENHFAEPA